MPGGFARALEVAEARGEEQHVERGFRPGQRAAAEFHDCEQAGEHDQVHADDGRDPLRHPVSSYTRAAPRRDAMNILIALTYYRPHYSGLTVYAERLARALARRGHEVTVLTSRYLPELPAAEVRDGVRILRLDVALRVSKGVLMPGMLSRAWPLIRRADVVNLHVPQFDAAWLALVARLARKPAVMTYHCDLRLPGGAMHALANLVSNAANRLAAGLVPAIVTNTRDYAEHSPFLRRHLGKVHEILPPVEMAEPTAADVAALRARAGLVEGDRVIGMVARLATEKGVEHLAAALPAVIERVPRARVLFAGEHERVFGEEACARRVIPLVSALGDRWRFLGNLGAGELAALYRACDVTVLPSVNSTESFGMVQVESLLAGVPVVSTDLPGVRQPVRLSGRGRIVPPADPAALASALGDLLSGGGRADGDTRQLAARVAPDAVAEAYEMVFRSCQGPGAHA